MHQAIIIIIGVSGAGKSTLVRRLLSNNLVQIVPTWTTRPRRKNESEIEHHFVDESEFQQAVLDNKFIGVTQLFGLPYTYGLPKIPITQKPVVVMLRSEHVENFKRKYKEARVYHIKSDYSIVASRLQQRVHDGEDIGDRLQTYNKEVALGDALSDRTFANKNLDVLVRQIECAISEDFPET